MISRFFIDRPIFAWVIAIVIMMAGIAAIKFLPVEQYPGIAPPAVNIRATYPGASAQTLENTVTQVIEQQLNGIDNLAYFESTSDSSGQVNISVTFKAGTDPDVAQVQVQNKLQLATPRLPLIVQQQGITVNKSTQGFLMIVGLYDSSGKRSRPDLADYLVSNAQDPLSRINGVGQVQVFGGQYSMRIWLDPLKLNNYKLAVSDVISAVQAQNAQVSAGQIGMQPVVAGQELNAVVNAQSQLQTPEQFRNIILRADPSGAIVHLGDVARVEMGAENYQTTSRYNGRPSTGIGVQLAPGANAMQTAKLVRAEVNQLAKSFPPEFRIVYPFDSTPFIRLSIEEVVKTLIEAIVLVVLVMFLFLQNWRATLIPAIAVPVVLLGSFGIMAAAHFTINTLTMFGLVLAIGLLVDDAIVVVENVERIMTEEGLPPKEATRKSMGEITGALIGITMVLSAVFLPMAFFGGSTGVIYRQFSITIVSAMALSVMVALVLTPALCATLLKPVERGHVEHQTGFFGWFNRGFGATVTRYRNGLERIIAKPVLPLVLYALVVGVLIVLFMRLPTSFLPDEDQGSLSVVFTLPPGAVQQRTIAVVEQIEHQFLTEEKDNVRAVFSIPGYSYSGIGQNQGLAFILLKDWSERKGRHNTAAAIAQRATAAFARIRDADVYASNPPAIRGLGNSSGFDFELMNQGGLARDAFLSARNQLLDGANKDPVLAKVHANGQEDLPQLQIDVDQAKAAALGLSQSDINNTITTAWGSTYVNDFIDRGRVKRVYMQGDAPYRMTPQNLDDWYVRTASGSMAPFTSFATSHWTFGPSRLERYNGVPAFEILGEAAPGKSSGASMSEMEKLASRLPRGIGYAWTALSAQEKLSGAQAPVLYGLSVLVVFLCLAALYESWSLPFSVLLVIPLGVVGAVLAATLRGLANDIFFQVGLLTTIGLSAKNAILIVEFAESERRAGKDRIHAALEAARLRLRPILMTSLAFVAGVLPLAIATGAGGASRVDIGTGVIGGMLTATVLAIFFIPLFFVLVLNLFARGHKDAGRPEGDQGGPGAAGQRPPDGGAPEGAPA